MVDIFEKKSIVDIIPDKIQVYAEKFSDPEDPLLEAINKETLSSHPHAHMLSGHLQGRFLAIVSKMLRPQYILEIGTFTGYSALCLAEGLTPAGKLHTIELREEDAQTARQNFNRSNQADRIILHTGNALEIIPTLEPVWDLVFIDADKVSYQAYYDLVIPKMRSGGVILADNVLFHGQVVEDPITGKNAKAIHEFNQFLRNDDRVEKVIITLRDGLMMIRKK